MILHKIVIMRFCPKYYSYCVNKTESGRLFDKPGEKRGISPLIGKFIKSSFSRTLFDVYYESGC